MAGQTLALMPKLHRRKQDTTAETEARRLTVVDIGGVESSINCTGGVAPNRRDPRAGVRALLRGTRMGDVSPGRGTPTGSATEGLPLRSTINGEVTSSRGKLVVRALAKGKTLS